MVMTMKSLDSDENTHRERRLRRNLIALSSSGMWASRHARAYRASSWLSGDVPSRAMNSWYLVIGASPIG
jgi:hypothetical protein